MKPKSTLRSFLLGCSSLLVASSLPAAPLYWDGTDTGLDADGGDGTWIDDSGTTTNWDDAATSGNDTAWTNANNYTAVFGGATGTVTIDAGGVTGGGLQFDTAGYTLSGGVLTFGAAGGITANENATISSELAGSVAIEKAGAASLTLSGVNTSLSSPWTLSAGTLVIDNADSLGTGTLTFDNGGTAPASAVFSAASTYSNVVTVAAGSTDVNTIQSTSAGTVKLDGAVTVNTGTTLKLDNSGDVFDMTSVITGDGGLETTGSSTGNFIFRGASTYSGDTLLSASGIFIPTASSSGPAGSPTDGVFGTGTLTINDISMRSTNLSETSIGNTLVLAGNLTGITASNEKNLIFTGPATLTGTRTINNAIGQTVSASSLIFSGAIGDGGNDYGLIKQGNGVLTLTGNNTFGGNLAIGGGRVRVGSNSSAGNGGQIISNGDTNITFASADATALTLTKTVSANLANGGITFGDTIGTGDLTFTGDLTRAGGSTNRSVNVSGSTTATFDGNLLSPGTASASTTFTKGGTGTLAIKGTGGGTDGFSSIVVTGGAMAVTRLADLGVTSSLGAAAKATPGAVSITLDNGELRYIDGGGAASATNRLLQIGRTTNNRSGTIRNNATDASETVTFSNMDPIAYGTVDQTRTLVLGGTNIGANTIASAIGDNGTAAVSLTKQDAGTWGLSGTNTYTGVTQITGGVLRLDSAGALPGGIGVSGGLGALTFNNGVLGLGDGDFTRPQGASGAVGKFYMTANGGWAAYVADRIVNIGGSNALVAWGSGTGIYSLNGKTLILGSSSATHKVTVTNPLNTSNATRPIRVDDGAAPVDGELSGVIQNSVAGGGINKSGDGTLLLSNNNTYTGNTLVTAGTVTVSGSLASAKVTIDSGATFNGTGTLTFNVEETTADQVVANGTINLAGLTVAVNEIGLGLTETEYVLVDATGGGTISGTFAGVTGASGYALDYGTANQVKLVQTGGSAYSTWADNNAPTGNPDEDFDGDGVSNAVEFVLGGDKDTNDLGKLPIPATSGGNMTFTFVRDQDSVDGSTLVTIEVGTDLAAWPTTFSVGADTGSSTAGVVVTDNLDGTDTVILTMTQAPDAKKFARLKVSVVP